MTPAANRPVTHPSPDRQAVSLARLVYGLVAAPLAWLVGQLAGATLAQAACFPGVEPRTAPAFDAGAFATVVLAASLAVSASAVVIAFVAWRRTQREGAGGPHDLIEIGEGRARFMAIAGILTSLGFLVGGLFTWPALILAPAC
jgi:hypothetical protein